MNIERFRTVQTIVSIILFTLVFFFCWNTTKFDLKNIQLSYWGADTEYSWLWNLSLVLLSVSIYINVFFFIQNHRRLIFKRFLHIVFFLVSLSLFFTGALNMHHKIHNFVAFFYFFAYPLAIFALAHLNRKHLQYKEWREHLIFSIVMVVLPLVCMNFFHGKAIPETLHSVIVMMWNLYILLRIPSRVP